MMVKFFEGRRASDYDRNILALFPGYEDLQIKIKNILSYKLARLPTPHILSAGCGTGAEIKVLLESNAKWHVTGIDPSSEMISQAKIKLSNFRPEFFTLIKGLINELNENEFFDAATLLLVLHFIPDDGSKLTLLSQISARLKKNSPFVLVDIFGSDNEYNLNLEMLRVTLIQKAIKEEVICKLMEHLHQDLFICTRERQAELLSLAGFKDVVMFSQELIYGGWIAEKG